MRKQEGLQQLLEASAGAPSLLLHPTPCSLLLSARGAMLVMDRRCWSATQKKTSQSCLHDGVSPAGPCRPTALGLIQARVSLRPLSKPLVRPGQVSPFSASSSWQTQLPKHSWSVPGRPLPCLDPHPGCLDLAWRLCAPRPCQQARACGCTVSKAPGGAGGGASQAPLAWPSYLLQHPRALG